MVSAVVGLSAAPRVFLKPESCCFGGFSAAIGFERTVFWHAGARPLEPLRLLREEGFEPVICWTNPNIQAVAEHERRLETLLAWARDVAKVEVIVAGDRLIRYLAIATSVDL